MYTQTLAKGTLAGVAAIILLTGVADAASKVDKAVCKAVVERKKTEKVKAFGHHFAVKPVRVRRIGNGYKAVGSFRHRIRFRPDNYYSYVVWVDKRGRITKLQEKVNKRGLTVLTGLATKAGAGEAVELKSRGSVSKKRADKYIKKAGSWIERRLTGNWQAAARKTVVRIARRVARHYGKHRRKSRRC